MVKKAKYIAELDGTSYFNQFKLHSDIRKWFTFSVGKKRWAWKRMPMGWSYSVYIAQAVTETLIRNLTDVDVLVYIDNVYITGDTPEAVERAQAQFLRNCEQVGASFEVSTPLGTKCKVLGMDVDLQEKTVKLSDSTKEKLELLRQHFTTMHDDGWLTNHTLWIILGNVLWAARILEEPMCRYPNLTAWVSDQSAKLASDEGLWKHRVKLWPKSKRQLQDLLTKLCDNVPWKPPLEEGLLHTLYSDASNIGYGFVHAGAVSHTCAESWTDTMKERTIAERELYAARMGIADAVTTYQEGNIRLREIHLIVDNTNCVSWLNKRRGKSYFVNALLTEIEEVLGKVSLRTTYIQSADNPADRPSRFPAEYRSVRQPKAGLARQGP